MKNFGGDLVLLIETHMIPFWLYSNSSLSISFSNSDRILFFPPEFLPGKSSVLYKSYHIKKHHKF